MGILAVSAALGVVFAACGEESGNVTTGGGTTQAGGNGGGPSGPGGNGTGGDGGTILNGPGSGGQGAMQGCNPETFSLQQAPSPEMYLVIDRSGSMLEPGATPGVNRWDEMKAAIDSLLVLYESNIDFGLLMYPSDETCATEGPQVPVAPNNRLAINAALNAATPAGGTPTAYALNNAGASLGDLGDPNAPKFILLATDGGPNCNYFLSASPECGCMYAPQPEYCCTNYPLQCYFGSTCLDDQHTLDVITDLQTNQNVDTFVIGFGGGNEYETLLNEMALVGGQPQMGGTTDYYPADDQLSLQTAMQTIAVSILSCQIQLAQAPEYPDGVTIYVDGMEVPHDETKTNGWDYTDDTHTVIELYGSYCDQLQDGEEHQLTATFQCDIQ
jgi:hypothetical protein